MFLTDGGILLSIDIAHFFQVGWIYHREASLYPDSIRFSLSERDSCLGERALFPAEVATVWEKSFAPSNPRGFYLVSSNILLWRLIMKCFLWSFSPFCWFKKGQIDHEMFSVVILSLLLIKEGPLSVSGKRMRTFWSEAYNSIFGGYQVVSSVLVPNIW